MPTSFQSFLGLLGRVLVVALFLPSGIGKITSFAGTVGYISAHGLPLPQVAAVIAILVEVGVALAFLVGFKTRSAGLILAIYAVLAGIFFHNYWDADAAHLHMQQINFFKNLAIAGGLLSFASWGGGGWSMDARRGA
ncbi:MAG: DoxX family protein [Rhodoferax sp.]